MAGLGAIRQDAAWLRPVRPTMLIFIPLVKFDLETSTETRFTPLLPHFVPPVAPLYPESVLNCYKKIKKIMDKLLKNEKRRGMILLRDMF